MNFTRMIELLENLNTQCLVQTVSRPDDTDAYTANDVVGTKSTAAVGYISFSDVVADGETFTIGADVYEFDTDAETVAGNIPVDVSLGASGYACWNYPLHKTC